MNRTTKWYNYRNPNPSTWCRGKKYRGSDHATVATGTCPLVGSALRASAPVHTRAMSGIAASGHATGSPVAPFLLLGVMSNPSKPILRVQWREWASQFREHQKAVRVRYVFGKTMYLRHVDPGPVNIDRTLVKDLDLNDHMMVEGREKLPHVGVVTEKSAYFWRSAVTAEPSAQWYCKCDDDTLVHLDRLVNVLKTGRL